MTRAAEATGGDQGTVLTCRRRARRQKEGENQKRARKERDLGRPRLGFAGPRRGSLGGLPGGVVGCTQAGLLLDTPVGTAPGSLPLSTVRTRRAP